MLMEMFTRVYGLMIRLMDRVYISIPMEQFIAGIGLKISKKVMELKLGQMELGMKGTISKDKRMVILFKIRSWKILVG